MKPVGLVDPRASARGQPYAVVQLRQEDRAGQMWNLVGFQTRLRTAEQQRVFRMIPGLERAEFLRYGSLHRNAYINSPRALTAHLSTRRSEEHTSELQSHSDLVCRLLLEKKKIKKKTT